MTTPAWTRPALNTPRPRTVLIVGALVAGLAFSAGVNVAGESGSTVVPIVTPVTVMPAPVSIAPPVIAEPAPTPVVPEPSVEPAPPPRAIVPKLDAACVLLDDSEAPACKWDDGFPAISTDGKLIATKHVPDDGGRGNPGLEIHFIEPESSRLVRRAMVLAPDEFDQMSDRAKLQARIDTRVVAIQRMLDARRFRTLQSLGTHAVDTAGSETSAGIHAQVVGEAVRIVDPASSTVLWQHRFGRPAGADPDPESETGLCGAWSLREVSIWWEPTSKLVLASRAYQTGGCMCEDVTVEQVWRM